MFNERFLSSVVLILFILFALFLFPPQYFTFTLGLIICLAIWEWTQFAHIKASIPRLVITAIIASLFLLWIISELDYLKAGIVFIDYQQILLLLAIIWWPIALILVMSYPTSAKIWGKSSLLQLVFAFCTIMPFFVSVLRLRFDNYMATPYRGALLLLYVFILIWSADSGAYFFGRRFGKTKLAPKVSPGKTWQGVLGGMLTAAIFATIFIQLSPSNFFSVSMQPFVILSVATVVISVLGDLTESMFKREAGIKDSSNLIPGHGGILDRMDSLTAALPFFSYFYFYVL